MYRTQPLYDSGSPACTEPTIILAQLAKEDGVFDHGISIASMMETADPEYFKSVDEFLPILIKAKAKDRFVLRAIELASSSGRGVRGLAPETQVGLSGYSATIKLRDDSGWHLCITSDAAPALSPESTFFIEYCAGGPSSATPVLLSCVASFDTAPPPQDLLAGLLYTAPPPSTGDGSFDSYLSSP
ncbi:uncharacterized protein UHOD_11992 [Ustilago sp. UG-2017b]|nr:uncharacterized protein UHOD_11992 [Ustilago sp. UG-2017b]